MKMIGERSYWAAIDCHHGLSFRIYCRVVNWGGLVYNAVLGYVLSEYFQNKTVFLTAVSLSDLSTRGVETGR